MIDSNTYNYLFKHQQIINNTDNSIDYYIDNSSGEIALTFKNNITGSVEFITTHGYKIRNLSDNNLKNIQQQIHNNNNINERQLKEIYINELITISGTSDIAICPCCHKPGIVVNDTLNCTYINCSGWNHLATYHEKLQIIFPSLVITDELVNNIIYLMYKTTSDKISHIREIDINMLLLVLSNHNNKSLGHDIEKFNESLKYINHVTAMKLGKIPNGLSDQIYDLMNRISVFNTPFDLFNLSGIDFSSIRGAEYYIKNFVSNNTSILPLLSYHKSSPII